MYSALFKVLCNVSSFTVEFQLLLLSPYPLFAFGGKSESDHTKNKKALGLGRA